MFSGSMGRKFALEANRRQRQKSAAAAALKVGCPNNFQEIVGGSPFSHRPLVDCAATVQRRRMLSAVRRGNSVVVCDRQLAHE